MNKLKLMLKIDLASC